VSVVEKIFFYKDIDRLAGIAKDRKTVLVGGCFDIFHFGHLTFLKKAKKVGDFLIIALESDEFIKEKKIRGPIHNQGQRAEILASFSLVDAILMLPFLRSDEEYFEMTKKIKPRIVAITKGDPQKDKKEKQVKLSGGHLIEVSRLITDFSTSRIIKILSC